MVTDRQVRRLFALDHTERTLAIAAAKAGMDEKTARKYRLLRKLPSELKGPRTWRTREDPFEDVWEQVRAQLELNPGLEAKTIFRWLQSQWPGRFQDGQLRTFQRRVKVWRATEGPAREVFFAQVHCPGELSQSDFTHMGEVGVTIGGQRFEHLLYHFVLTYSNWEHAKVCFSESFESLSEGLQGSLWTLGAVPRSHRSDRMSAAVCPPSSPEIFTGRYQGLLDHYGIIPQRINTGRAHENGDVEQRHHRFKRAMVQALMLRGSRDFASRDEYERFIAALLDQLNAGRRQRLEEELVVMRPLPACRLEACRHVTGVRVDCGSLIHVQNNAYSVNSRLIGERVDVRLYAEHLEVWYGQRMVERMERLRGRGRHLINYRHVIDWLLRKPGAFENYRYRAEMFPTSRFRLTYDELRQRTPASAVRQYLRILELAAKESEAAVDEVLRQLIERERSVDFEVVEHLVREEQQIAPAATNVVIGAVDAASYDVLIETQETRDKEMQS